MISNQNLRIHWFHFITTIIILVLDHWNQLAVAVIILNPEILSTTGIQCKIIPTTKR